MSLALNFNLRCQRNLASNIFRKYLHLLNQNACINGEWVQAKTGKTFNVTNPSNGETIASIPDMDLEDAKLAVESAKEAFKIWKNVTAKERSQILRKWYNLLVENQESIARIMTTESGKPLVESRGELQYGNSFVEWFSEEARRIDGEVIASPTPTKRIVVEKQPIGVVGLITPWNFPHAMITRKAGAALAAGCTCVIKPAEDTPLTCLAAVQLAYEAGFPKGVLNVVTCGRSNAPKIGDFFCTSKDVAGISFTGSTAVGKYLYKQCADGLKRIGLELGGDAPFIVFNSANLKNAVQGAMTAKFRNCGQTCVAANRFLVQEGIFDEFIAEFKKRISAIPMGDGFKENVMIGPLINQPQLHKVSEIVNDAVSKGAEVVLGGKPATALGSLFYEPTLLIGITKDMRVYREEVFGPVAVVIKFKTEQEALDIANDTRTGLAGYFYSENISQIFRVARELEVGMVGINEGLISTAEAPFGGIKESGIGREGSHHGVDDYVYVKYMCFGNL